MKHTKGIIFCTLLLCLVYLTSCQKNTDEPLVTEDGDKLLPVSVTYNGQNAVDSFVYDNDNRMIESWYHGPEYNSKTVYTYKNNAPASMEYYDTFPGRVTEKYLYSDKNNNAVVETRTYYSPFDGSEITDVQTYLYNDKGQIIKGAFEDGTVTQEITWDALGRPSYIKHLDNIYIDNEFTYDDKKGIFSSVNTLFGFDVVDSYNAFHNAVNNVVKQVSSYTNGDGQRITETETFTYIYNEQGYPVQLTYTENGGSVTAGIAYTAAK